MSNTLKTIIVLLGLVLLWFGTITFRRAPIEQDLTAHVRQALSRPEFSKVMVSFEAREGLLTGVVSSGALKEEVAELARRYWGVRSITNRIEVAALSADVVQTLGATFGAFADRIGREAWIDQAKALHSAKYGETL